MLTTEQELDPRAKRTRQSLRQAVLHLMESLNIADISVQDITRDAGVNRATFYLHYTDRDDLIAQTFDALFAEYTAEMLAAAEQDPLLTYYSVPLPIHAQLKHIQQHAAFYRRVFAVDMQFSVCARLIAFCENQFHQMWSDGGYVAAPGSPDCSLRASFCAYAGIGAIRWWIERDFDPAAEIVAEHMWQMIRPLWNENVTRTT